MITRNQQEQSMKNKPCPTPVKGSKPSKGFTPFKKK